jgi:hypothetical protein
MPVDKVDDFLEANRQMPNQFEFWSEEYRSSIIAFLETRYRPEIIKKWQISDVVINGDKFLIKWSKRIIPG